MSPFRSSAGPATVRMPTPSSSRTICASVVLPRPGRADEQDVVERLAARLGGVERDRELLLDALLADEVVEPARPERDARVLLVRREDGGGGDRTHAACLSASRTRSSAGSSGSIAGERLLGLEQRVAELDERIARARRPALAGSLRIDVASPAPSLPFSSSTIRSAVFLPIPGIAWKRAVSSSAIARRSSAADEPETIASATFGPDAVDGQQCVKSSRSSASAKP